MSHGGAEDDELAAAADEEEDEEEEELDARDAGGGFRLDPGAPEAFLRMSVMPSAAPVSILNQEKVTLPLAPPPFRCAAVIRSPAAADNKPLAPWPPSADKTCDLTSRLAGPAITATVDSPSIVFCTNG